MPINQYKVLQVTRHSTTLDIRKNYKKLSKLYHPDKNSDNLNEFNDIKVAYDVRLTFSYGLIMLLIMIMMITMMMMMMMMLVKR